MSFLSLQHGVVHYRDIGRRDGVPIVFVNSLGTDFRVWDGVVERLAPDFRIIVHDKRGHGLSAVPPAPYAIADFAGDLMELADRLGLDRFVVAGVSVGGMIAMRFAIDHPECVAALVLCDTAAKIGDAATWNGRIEAVRSGGMEAVADAVLLRWFPEAIRAGREAEIDGWRNLLLRTPVEGYVGSCMALRDADLTDELGRIAAPTLVVAGEVDQSTPVALVRATAGRISGAGFEVIERAGHIPSIDQPARLARLIRDHVEAHVHG